MNEEYSVIFGALFVITFLVILIMSAIRAKETKEEEKKTEYHKLKKNIEDICEHFSETVLDFEDKKTRDFFTSFIKGSSLKVVLLDSQFANLPKELLDEIENLQKSNRIKIVVSNQQIPVERFFIEYPSKNKNCMLFSTNPKIRILAREMGVSIFEGKL